MATTTKKHPAKPSKSTKRASGSKLKANPDELTPPKRLGAIDAAAQVLAEAAEPLSAKQMIERMTAQKLWTSPGGKTPEATLYAAIVREIAAKGRQARFVKTDRGRFAARK
jgi:hypothetical protein